MPLKLNLNANTFATTDLAFVALLKDLWRARYAKIKANLLTTPPYLRERAMKDTRVARSRLRSLCTNQAALDKELTRLRGLPYASFTVHTHNGLRYLLGLTRPIKLDTPSADPRKLAEPRFFVYIPENVFEAGSGANFHFIPEGRELTCARHPHHIARTWRFINGSREAIEDLSSPLNFEPNTCWGSFGSIITACISDGDLVDLFRNIQIYLTRHNPASPLADLESCLAFWKNGTPYENHP